MKNQFIIIAVLGVLAVGGFAYYINSAIVESVSVIPSAEDHTMARGDMMEKMGEEMVKPEGMMEEKVMEKNAEMTKGDTMTAEKKLIPTVTPVVVAPTGKAEVIKPVEMMKEKGSYVPYEPALIAKAQNGKVVLFFRASWCPSCKSLDSNIRANMNAIPDGVTVLDVNYDNSADLKKKYGVTYQHTMVQVDKDGVLIKKWSGSPTLVALVAEIK